jgi:hypothetical protein
MWMSPFLFCTFAALVCISSAYFTLLLCYITVLALYFLFLFTLSPASFLLPPFTVVQIHVPESWLDFLHSLAIIDKGVSIIDTLDFGDG